MTVNEKTHDLLIFLADRITDITNFTVITNVVMKRVHCISAYSLRMSSHPHPDTHTCVCALNFLFVWFVLQHNVRSTGIQRFVSFGPKDIVDCITMYLRSVHICVAFVRVTVKTETEISHQIKIVHVEERDECFFFFSAQTPFNS